MRVFKRAEALTVTFCERCGEVCNAGRRRAALRDRALLGQLWAGGRL